jgi:hypothetical protein
MSAPAHQPSDDDLAAAGPTAPARPWPFTRLRSICWADNARGPCGNLVDDDDALGLCAQHRKEIVGDEHHQPEDVTSATSVTP